MKRWREVEEKQESCVEGDVVGRGNRGKKSRREKEKRKKEEEKKERRRKGGGKEEEERREKQKTKLGFEFSNSLAPIWVYRKADYGN